MKTLTMSVVGTPNWMAPELLRSERYSEKSDVWSFGIVIYEVVTLSLPYEGMSPISVMRKVAYEEEKLELEGELVVQYPELLKVYNSCVQHNPNLRIGFKEIKKVLQKK